jgi:hypothetical protein
LVTVLSVWLADGLLPKHREAASQVIGKSKFRAFHKPVTAIIAPVNGVGAFRQAQSKKEKGGMTIAAMLRADVTKVT